MSDFHQTAKQGEEAGKPEALLTPAESSRLLQVITALNLVRMNLGMYPPGHVRITESLDAANAVIQAALSRGPEWIVGFPGDTVTFGEKAPERDKKNNAFKDFARSLNSLRIVSFRLRRGLKKDELLEFCRILSAKPADIWAMGKIEAVFARAGIKAVEITVVDADRFRLGERKAVEAARERPEVDARFWQSLLARLKPAAEGAAGGEGPADEERMERSEALRFLNSGRGHWPSAVVGYEKIFHHYLSQRQKGPKTGAELEETLAGINALILDLHPQLKQQLMEVIQRQFALHSGAPLSPEDLQCFPAELLREVLHQTNEQGAMISPVLVNLLKKMTGIEKSAAAPDQGGELSSADMETLLRREQYENYVPEEYDALLKKAAEDASSGVAGGDPRFPLQELLKTLADAHVDFRICQFCRFLLEEGTDEADCLASARKLERSLPDLLRAGRFQWLTSLLETLRRHVREMPSDPLRQQASLLLRSLTRKETVARHVAPFIRDGKGDQAALRAFLVAGGSQNLSWLFDLLLDPRTALNETLVGIIQGFGREATEEALRRIPGRDPQGIVRLLTLIRGVGEKVDASSLKELLPNEDWKVRREVIRTLIRFDDPAAGELLRTTLQSKERDRVLEAVGLSCRYRVEEMLADLQALIRIVLMREEDAILNEWIVGEMMKTGHPAVVPLLEKIASARLTISPKHLARLKRTLYRNLQRLPKEKIGKLLKMGSKSGDREIRTVCAAAAKSKE